MSIVIAQFDNAVQSCEKVSFSQLNSLNSSGEKGIYPLEIRDRLQLFLKLLIGYLGDGASCVHFHETKLKELFWNIRFYYTRTEQASFSVLYWGMTTNSKRKCLIIIEMPGQ